jgi:subtilisin family serine protease
MVGMPARRIFLAAVVAALCIASVAVVAAASATAASPLPAVRAELQQAASARGANVPMFTVVRNGGRLVVLRGKSTRAGLADLRRRLDALPGVLSAEQDGIAHADDVNDPLFSQQWAFNAVDYQSVWPTTTGAGEKVAVIDTGVRWDHEDLIGNVDDGADCTTASTSDNCTTGTHVGGTDVYGHGTHVSGIIAAHANNGKGIAGAAPGAHILPVVALDSSGSGTLSAVASAIIWATDHGANVISMSLSAYDDNQGVHDAVNYALGHNIPVVAAAGNNFQSSTAPYPPNVVQYPADYDGVISVGSIQDTSPYTRSSFSNTSSHVALVAPGSNIISTLRTTTSSYGDMSGTSMATPYVSAAVALLRSVNQSLTPAQIATALENSAVPLSDSGGFGSATGFGIVNPLGALSQPGVTTTTTSTSSTSSTSTTSTTNPSTSTSTSTSTTTSTSASTTTTTPTVPASTTTTTVKPPPVAPPHGYWVAGRDGRVRGFGLPTYGDRYGKQGAPIIAIAATKTGKGYWLAGSDGAVYAFGDAKSYGSMAGHHLNAPMVAMAVTKSGHGYFLMGLDGGIFTFGDARFRGSMGGHRLNAPIVDIATTPTGNGYWLVGSDGGIFTFGDATYHGSTGGHHLAAPVVSMAARPTGGGYWLIARDGGVFTFGPTYYGSLPSRGVHKTVVHLRSTPDGGGYYILANDGSVYAFGDATYRGWSAFTAVDITVV